MDAVKDAGGKYKHNIRGIIDERQRMSVFRPNILHDAHNDPLIVLKARELNDPL